MEPNTPRVSQRYKFADLTLCVGERRLSRGDEEIRLSRLSFEFLLALVEAAPNLVSHNELNARVWGRRQRVVTPENLAKRALMLRNALGDHAHDPKYFEVLRGQGYRLLPKVVLSTGETTARRKVSSLTAGATGPASAAVQFGAAAAIIVAVAAVILTRAPRPAPDERSVVRFELVMDPEMPFVSTRYSRDVAISSDGEVVAYTSQDNSIVVRRLDSLQPRRIAILGTDIRNPTFSPDGLQLAFLEGGALKSVPAAMPGPVTTLANVGQFTDGDISWAADGSILVANSRGLLRVPESGGTPEILLIPDVHDGERSFGSPSLLPGGHSVMFSVEPTESSSGSRVVVYDFERSRKIEVLRNATEPTYLSSGYLGYIADREIRVARFDPETMTVADTHALLASDIRVHTNGTAPVDMSDDGTLIYISGSMPSARDLVWVERDGSIEPLPVPALNFTYPRLSPLGTHIALDARWPESDIWLWDLARKSLVRVTHDPAENALPVWHPDGQQLAFGDGRGGFANVYWHSLNSGAGPTRLTEGTARQLPFSISPDGNYLLVGEDQPNGNWHMWSLNLQTLSRTELLDGPYSYWNTDFSPDGRWLVYQSDESGDLEVYVRPFPKTDGGRWKISRDGGSKPMWSRDGREIYYIDPDGWLIAVAVETFPKLRVARATPLFDTTAIFDQPYESGARPYDLSADGGRFLFTRNVTGATSPRPRLIVAVNAARGIDDL